MRVSTTHVSLRALLFCLGIVGIATMTITLTTPDAQAEGAAGSKLSKPEAALQGTWKAKSGWVLVFDGHTFSAKSGSEWYEGVFSAPDTEDAPAPLNLDIEDCATCGYKGLTSESIYEFHDGGLLMSGGTPGKSRPPIFDETMRLVLEMTRVDNNGDSKAKDKNKHKGKAKKKDKGKQK